MTEPAVVDVALEVPAEAHARSRPVGRVSIPHLAGLFVSCLIVVLAFSPILLGGRTLSAAAKGDAGTNGASPFPGQPAMDYSYDYRADRGASTWALEPWAEVTNRAYLDGELPLWNAYQGAGTPHAANMQSAVFDPLLLAVNLHPTPLTWDLSIVGAFVLGAAAAYLFARILGLRVVPAVVTSAAFSLSGWFFLYSNNHFSRSYVFLPLIFLLVELALRSRRLWPVFGLGVAVAGNLLVGMPEASFFAIGASSVYGAVRLVQERAAMPIRVSLVRLCGGLVLGLMLASPLVLMFLQYESLSFNVHQPELGRGSEADPVLGLLSWSVPFFPGAPEGSPRSWFGVAVGISALVAMSGREETKRLHAWLFLLLGVFLLVKVYDFGVLGWVGRLPVAKLVVFPVFAPPVISFAFAVLAGIGVQVLWNRDLRLRRFLTLLALTLTVSIAALLTVNGWPAITDDHARVGGRTAFLALLTVAVVALASRRGRRWGAPVLAGLIVAELFLLAPFDIYARRADPFATPGWMAFVRSAQEAEPHSRVFGLDGKLYPDTAGALGLQDIRVLDALYVERYWRYVRTFIEPVYDRYTGTEVSPAQLRANPMFDALGVRVVLSQRDLANVPELRLVGRELDTRVYEKTDASPRAWVVHDVHVVEGEDDAFAFLQARARRRGSTFVVDRFDPRREAVVERHGTSADESLRAIHDGRAACAAGGRDRARIENYSGGSVSLTVHAACAGLLVLPDTYFPGWKATVNGRDREIYPTNGAFRGVIVPEGTSRVVFRYEPRAFPIGIVLAVLGLVAFVLVALVTRRRSGTTSVRAESVGSLT